MGVPKLSPEAFGGFRRGEMILLVAKEKAGKSRMFNPDGTLTEEGRAVMGLDPKPTIEPYRQHT